MRGGSCSTKNGWKAVISFSTVPIWPSSVDPMTDIFQVVMLSASLNFSCARPCLSVSRDGCQTRVSGKYSRRRGVEDCCGPPGFVLTLPPLSSVKFLPVRGNSTTDLDTEACDV